MLLLIYSKFTYAANRFPKEFHVKTRQKKIVYIQFMFKNAELNESMGINSMDFMYVEQGIVKNT